VQELPVSAQLFVVMVLLCFQKLVTILILLLVMGVIVHVSWSLGLCVLVQLVPRTVVTISLILMRIVMMGMF
jgi:hypothetical protein